MMSHGLSWCWIDLEFVVSDYVTNNKGQQQMTVTTLEVSFWAS
jgi:hypothetical protein